MMGTSESIRSNYRIPIHYCMYSWNEAAAFEERGISIHMQISGRVFWSVVLHKACSFQSETTGRWKMLIKKNNNPCNIDPSINGTLSLL